MRPSVLRALAAAGALVTLAAAGAARSATDAGRVPLSLTAAEPAFVPAGDGGVTPRIDGFGLSSRPGEPALPLRILLVAIPDGVEPSLAILAATSREIPGVDVAPVPVARVRDRDEVARALHSRGAAAPDAGHADPDERRRAWPWRDPAQPEYRRDPRIYAGKDPFPEAPVRLGRVGWMRDQRFVEVLHMPLLYDPARGGARFFDLVEAEVRFEGAAGAGEAVGAPAAADPHFEAAYAAALHNYEQGRLFRTRRRAADPSRQTGPEGALPAAETSPGAATPADDPPGPRYKMSVTQQGIYRLGHTWLAANAPGILAVDPRTIGIEVDGVEIPIAVRDAAGGNGEADGVFGAGDVIEFHGGPKIEPLTILNHDLPTTLPDVYQVNDFTDTQVYWLGASGAVGSHLRMPEVAGAPVSGLPLADDFEATATWDENNFFVPLGAGDPYVSTPSLLANSPSMQRDMSLALPGLAPPGAPASIAVRLRGGSSLGTVSPDHRTKIWANSDEVNVADFTWDGETDVEQVLALPQASLSDPVTVHLQAIVQAGVGVDRQYADRIVVTYRRLFTAIGEALVFRFPNQNARFQVGGLGAVAPTVLEISRPVAGNGEPAAVRIAGASPSGAPTNWTFEVHQDAAPDAPAVRTFIVAGAAGFQVPAAIQPAAPAALKVAGQAADMVVIAAPAVVDASPGGALDNLLAHRLATQGLTSKVVYIDQIYDEFSGGRRDANAVRSFLAWTYANWRGPAGTDDPPSFVLIVGDSTSDYKNNLARLDWIDQVPTPILLQVNSIIGFYSSDNWLASFNGADQIPDVHLGRITTRDAAASAAVFDKIRLFEATPAPGAWKGRGLLSAGDGRVAGEELTFQAINDTLRDDYFSQAPFNTPSPPLYFAQPPWNGTDFAGFNADLKAEIQAGAAVLNYVGHGSFDTWGYHGSFFTTADTGPGVLTNGLRLPFMLNIDCLSGGFHYLPSSGAIAEGLVNNPAGGAVATFAPSGLSFAFIGAVVAEELFVPLLGPLRDRTLGPATLPVRTRLWSQGSVVDAQSYTFLGDPASLLATPAPEPPTDLAATGGNGQVTLAWTPPAVPAASIRVYRAATNALATYQPITCAPAGPSSCLDTTVINGTRYYYRAVSVDAEQFEGRWSNFNSDCDAGPDCVTAMPVNPNPPTTPTGLQIADPGSGGRLDVSWNANPENDVKRYTVRFGTSSGVYTFSASVLAPATGVALQGLTNGVRYYLTVTATNTADLESAPSPEQSGVPHLFEGIAPPRAISDLQIDRSGANLVLNWSRPVVDIYGRPTTVAGYRVYRGTTPGYQVTSTPPLAVINDGAITTYTHTGGATLPDDGYYLVTALDAAGLASGAGHDLPNAIGDLDVSFVAPSTVSLTWSPITSDVQGKEIVISHYQVHATATPVGRAGLGPATLVKDNVTATSTDVTLAASPRYISVLVVDSRGNLSPN